MQFLITHRIAGITFRGAADILIPHLLNDPFNQFRIGDGKPDVHYHICQLDSDFLAFPPLDDQERERITRTLNFPPQWLDRSVLRSPDVRGILRDCLDQPELVHIGLRWNRVVIRDFAHNELHFFYPSEEKNNFAEPIFIARYRNLLGRFFLNFSAMMVHASGVIWNGMAVIFLAPDEGGKTSVVKQSQSVPILNDDHIVLCREKNVIRAHATPFGSLTSGPQSARLGGIFLLDKSSRFKLTSIPASEALQFLWREHLHAHVMLPKSLKVRAFKLLTDACHQAPTYRMSFPKDYVDWVAIDAAIAQQM